MAFNSNYQKIGSLSYQWVVGFPAIFLPLIETQKIDYFVVLRWVVESCKIFVCKTFWQAAVSLWKLTVIHSDLLFYLIECFILDRVVFIMLELFAFSKIPKICLVCFVLLPNKLAFEPSPAVQVRSPHSPAGPQLPSLVREAPCENKTNKLALGLWKYAFLKTRSI